MTKIDFIICFLSLIGILVASINMFSNRFAERLDVGKNIQTVIATILTIIIALSVAVYVEFIHYVEFVLWRFSLITFYVFNITIAISVILALFKKQLDDRKKYREIKKLTRKTEKFIRNIKKNMTLDSCVTADNNSYSKSDKCMAIKGGNVINFEKAKRKKYSNIKI